MDRQQDVESRQEAVEMLKAGRCAVRPGSSLLGGAGLVDVHVVASSRIKRIPLEPVRWDCAPAIPAVDVATLGACVTVAAERAPNPLMPRRT